jgi:hypothetical protein
MQTINAIINILEAHALKETPRAPAAPPPKFQSKLSWEEHVLAYAVSPLRRARLLRCRMSSLLQGHMRAHALPAAGASV